MSNVEPRTLTIAQAAAQIRERTLTSEALEQSCLEHIDAREPEVLAWVRLYAQEALDSARACDRDAANQKWRGALHGIPLGFKDIFDVKGMETRGGTEAYEARVAEADAACIARLHDAGAIALGKTVTTAFALGDPGPTRNPWNCEHTPGGSSSGSGAGVAERMCLGALGSQTAGSVIRPASYNGVVGFKPSHGRISVEGVIALSWQLDHVGTFTRSVEDAALLWNTMRVDASNADHDAFQTRPALRIWRMRGLFEDNADPQMVAAMNECCNRLTAEGVDIVERDLPSAVADMLHFHRIVMASEAATYHRARFEQRGSLYPPRIAELIEEGLKIPAPDYIEALRHRRALIAEMAAALADVDGALSPAATGPAPEGLEFTGDRQFNSLSSYCGMPVVSFPVGLSDHGLPLGLQLMSGLNTEDDLLPVGGWIETLMPFHEVPGRKV